MGIIPRLKEFALNIKEAFVALFTNKTDIYKALGYDTAPETPDMAVYTKWQNILNGKAEWNNECTPPLKLLASASRAITGKTFVEFTAKVSSGRATAPRTDPQGLLYIDPEERYKKNPNEYNQYLDKQFAYATKDIQEQDIALNDMGKRLVKIAPYGIDILTMYYGPQEYIPLEYTKRGDLSTVLTWDTITRDNTVTTLYELIKYDAENKTILYKYVAFKSINGGNPIRESIKSVPEWQNLEPETTFPNVEHPWFFELKLPEGKPFWYNALELAKQADIINGYLLREYTKGVMQLAIPEAWLEAKNVPAIDSNGEIKRDPNGRIVYTKVYTDPDAHNKNYVIRNVTADEGIPPNQIIAPGLRDANYITGIEHIKREIERTLNISNGVLSEPVKRIMTATEIKQSERDTLVIVKNHQDLWAECFNWLILAIDEMAQVYGFAKKDEYQLVLSWGDGIKEADDVVEKRYLNAINFANQDPVYYRMWANGVSQDEAHLMERKGVPLSGE